MISLLTPQALPDRSAKGRLDLSLNIEIQGLNRPHELEKMFQCEECGRNRRCRRPPAQIRT